MVLLFVPSATAGLAVVVSAALLLRKHHTDNKRLRLPSHDKVPKTLIDLAAANVDHRFLTNGEPLEPVRFWQHLYWHKLAILCLAISAAICTSVPLLIAGFQSSRLSLALQSVQVASSGYLCFVSLPYLRNCELKGHWALTQHVGYLAAINSLLPFAGFAESVIQPDVSQSLWFLQHPALRLWYLAAASIDFATLVWVGLLPVAPMLYLDRQGLYTSSIDQEISEARTTGVPTDFTDVVDSAYCTTISYVLFLYARRTIDIINTSDLLMLYDLPAVEAKARAHVVLVKAAAYRKRTGARSVIRKVFGPYLRQMVLGNSLECILLFCTYLPYLCLQQILQMIEREERNAKVAVLYATFALLSHAIPNLANLNIWNVHHITVNDNSKSIVSLLIWFKSLTRRTFSAADDTIATENKADLGLSNADVMNLISSDANNIPQLSYTFRKVMTGPCEILVGGIFVWHVLGVSGLWGVASLALTAPLTYLVAKAEFSFERKRVHYQDLNVARLQELVQAIAHIKTTAQESYWRQIMRATKRQETRQLLWSKLLGAVLKAVHVFSPLLITVVAFAHYTLIRGEHLTPSRAFLSINLAVLYVLFPKSYSLRQIVSMRRVSVFLETPDVVANAQAGSNMIVSDATVSWAPIMASEVFRLRNIDLTFPDGLSLITGGVGSGKSMLLQALLGELLVEKGAIVFPSSSDAVYSVSYVPQVAWLQSASIRENILFGLDYDQERYFEVLEATCLAADLCELEDGDLTEIGERGKILSGGQKARVSLARAIYSKASVLLLDDVLSAVDASTASRIISRCLQGPLCHKRSIIIVSHAVSSLAPLATFACYLQDGRVVFQGTGQELHDSVSARDSSQPTTRQSSTSDLASSRDTLVEMEDASLNRQREMKALLQINSSNVKLVGHESRTRGATSWGLWRDFVARNGSYVFWMAVVVFELLLASTPLLQRSALRSWSNTETCRQEISAECSATNGSAYLWIYTGFCLLAALSAGALGIAEAIGAVKVTNVLFENMLDCVLGAKSRFYVTNTVGAIVQRFSRDLPDVDEVQTFLLSSVDALTNGDLAVLGWLGGVPLTIVLLVIFSAGARIITPFRVANREVRRLIALTGGPVNALLGESVAGAAVIRATGRRLVLTQELLGAINCMAVVQAARGNIWRWMQAHLFLVRNLVFAVVLYTVAMSQEMSAGTAGMYFSFVSTTIDQIDLLVLFLGRLDNNSVCLERTSDYCKLDQEEVDPHLKEVPAASWPNHGSILVTGVEARYAEDLPAVISDITFRVEGGQRVGIVGATGCGKSTLAKALFSFVEVTKGNIVIDDIDIARLRLQEVRSRMTMIGQDPTILSGTLRSNLDVDGRYSDDQLYNTLRQVRLITDDGEQQSERREGFVNVFENLDTAVQTGGLNFSVGQKQLLVIARALLRSHRILILDEATSSIDAQTDTAITQVIKDNFQGSTILVIAHRLRTIIDFDSIIVMDKGRIVQQGSPSELIDSEGPFQTLCKAAGDAEFESLRSLAHSSTS